MNENNTNSSTQPHQQPPAAFQGDHIPLGQFQSQALQNQLISNDSQQQNQVVNSSENNVGSRGSPDVYGTNDRAHNPEEQRVHQDIEMREQAKDEEAVRNEEHKMQSFNEESSDAVAASQRGSGRVSNQEDPSFSGNMNSKQLDKAGPGYNNNSIGQSDAMMSNNNEIQDDDSRNLNLQQRQIDEDSDGEGVITTTVRANNQQTPSQNRVSNANQSQLNGSGGSQGPKSNMNGQGSISNIQGLQGSSGLSSGSIPSYHMQQNLQISAQITKSFLDLIKKGDLQAVKAEQERLGLNIAFMCDENFRHNGIFYATLIKDHEQAFRMVEYLISQGVDPLANDTLNQTPLFYASREGKLALVDLFLKNGCQPNHLDTYGQTSIFYASREGHIEVCKRLVNSGADCDLVDNNGQTPLYYAVRGGKYDTVEFLINKGSNVNHEDKKQQTPMIIAKRSNKQQIINLLIAHGAKGIEDLRKQHKLKKQAAIGLAAQQAPVLESQASGGLNITGTSGGQNPKKASGQIGPQEKKQAKRYVLTVLKDGVWEPLTISELDKFEEHYPEIAKFWKDPSALESLQLPKFPENAPIYESWDKAAKRLHSSLWKFNQSWIFHNPVDPEKLGIPEYPNVIKNPMDLGTIKQRLSTNYYHRMQEFLDDMQLVFDNCLKFNGEDSHVGKIGKIVRDEFKKLYEQLNIEFYLN